MDNIYSLRVERVRALMRSRGWDAVVITGTDPHCSEYPADRWKCVRWISGFTGEAGDIVITADHAGLWTDTRYFIQAREQLEGTGIVLHKTRVPQQVLIPRWLSEYFEGQEDVVVAVDGLCQSGSHVSELKAALDRNGGIVIDVPDMLDPLWEGRPSIPSAAISCIDPKYTGETLQERLFRIREAVSAQGCDSILLTSLDEIAWALNIRGGDIDYNPYAISFLLVTGSDARWFVRKGPLSGSDSRTLDTFGRVEEDGVQVFDYADLELEISASSDGLGRLMVDPQTLNWHLKTFLEENDIDLNPCVSPVVAMKAIKNPVEIAGMREAHLADGVAMEKFLHWLETGLEEGRQISEWDAAVRLGGFRAESPFYRGDSFETISAYGPGAALPHYVTPRQNAPLIGKRGLYLCDSGGQYDMGTTDITRTVPTGPCSEREMEDYTLVLKGHIGLAMAIFPEGTPGCRLDVLARNPLWQMRRNFGHGTGHGVGFFLGVHEGPQDIRQNLNPVELESGMITSDEPGIYIEGQYGIRHENLILCERVAENAFGKWLGFSTLTLCHFDTGALVRELLTADETAWLNEYNARVYRELSPLLPPETAAWLKKKTAAI